MQTEPISKTTIHGLRTELADLCSIFTKALAAETPAGKPLPLFPPDADLPLSEARLDGAYRGPSFTGQALSYQKPPFVSSKFRHCPIIPHLPALTKRILKKSARAVPSYRTLTGRDVPRRPVIRRLGRRVAAGSASLPMVCPFAIGKAFGPAAASRKPYACCATVPPCSRNNKDYGLVLPGGGRYSQ